LGRESVIDLSKLSNRVEAIFWHGHGHGSGLLSGWILTNGTAFMVLAVMLYLCSARKNPHLRFAYLLVIAVVAASGVVVTPYDFLSYALITAVFLAVSSGREWYGVALMILAVATRESALLVIPVLVVSFVTPVESGPGQLGRLLKIAGNVFLRSRSILLVSIAGAATYVTLKILTMPSGRSPRFVQLVATDSHWGTAGVVGIATALLMMMVIQWSVGIDFDRRDIAVRYGLLWLLASPYLVVCLVWGVWSEAPRLVTPLVVGEFLIAASVVTHQLPVVPEMEDSKIGERS
jgi:hypothetical protein